MKKIESEGFTLAELLLTMAIIAILAGVITVSLSGQRQRASETKVLAELSGVLQPLYMCRTDGGNVSNAATGDDICDLGDGYGQWPALPDDFGEYTTGGSFGDSSWFFHVDDETVRICCNAKSSRCAMIPIGTDCTAVLDLSAF